MKTFLLFFLFVLLVAPTFAKQAHSTTNLPEYLAGVKTILEEDFAYSFNPDKTRVEEKTLRNGRTSV